MGRLKRCLNGSIYLSSIFFIDRISHVWIGITSTDYWNPRIVFVGSWVCKKWKMDGKITSKMLETTLKCNIIRVLRVHRFFFFSVTDFKIFFMVNLKNMLLLYLLIWNKNVLKPIYFYFVHHPTFVLWHSSGIIFGYYLLHTSAT